MALRALPILLLAAHAHAETIQAPRLVPNDTWTEQSTTENNTGWHQSRVATTVLHGGQNTIAVNRTTVGSTMPPAEQMVNADWSRFRSVNGAETVVARPFSFPLSVGKSWVVDYTEKQPNRAHSSEEFHTDYSVVGWEDVTVSAGTFHALKIEGEGKWTAVMAPAATAVSGTRVDQQGTTVIAQVNRPRTGTATGRIYKAYWYVPTVKRWVKSVEEYYNAGGTRTERYENTLESYSVSQ